MIDSLTEHPVYAHRAAAKRAPRPWSNREIRRLLRSASRPQRVALDPLARALAQALAIETPIAAIRRVVDDAFEGQGQNGKRLHDLIVACDLDCTQTQAEAAAAMHLSTRQFFRQRADAISAIASHIRALLAPALEPDRPLAALAELVGESEPEAAARIYDILDASGESPAPLARMRASLDAGISVDPSLDGDLRTSIMTTVLAARSREAAGERSAARALLANAECRVVELPALEADAVRFEIQAMHCLRARHEARAIDLAVHASQARDLAGDERAAVARATVLESEAALASGNVVAAEGFLNLAQQASYLSRDGRALGTAVLQHAQLAFLRSDYRKAEDYATAAGFASRHQPAEAILASIVAGRARLALAKRWTLEERFAQRSSTSWERVSADVLGARHLLLGGNHGLAAERSERALATAADQEYHGVWVQAAATLGACAGITGDVVNEQRWYRAALKRFAELGDALVGHDLFAMPGARGRDLGPLALDDELIDLIDELAAGRIARSHLLALIAYAADLERGLAVEPATSVFPGGDDRLRSSLAALLATSLHPERREPFRRRFDAAWRRLAV